MKKYLNFLKKKKFYLFLVAIIGFLVITIFVLKDGILGIDRDSYLFIKNYLISDKLTFYVKIITNFGSGIGLIILALLVSYLFKNKKISIAIFGNLIIVFLINTFLKIIFQRERPLVDNWLVKEFGYSFPSAHSMVSMAFYGFLIYLIYTNIEKKKWKYPVIILLSLIILLIGISRIYLGVHYLSDVLAGFLISIAYLVIFIYFYNKFQNSTDN